MNVLLSDDIKECVFRINEIRKYKALELKPFAQPYLDFSGKRNPPQWQKDMARWCNRKEIYNSTELSDFEPRKGFRFKKYLLES